MQKVVHENVELSRFRKSHQMLGCYQRVILKVKLEVQEVMVVQIQGRLLETDPKEMRQVKDLRE